MRVLIKFILLFFLSQSSFASSIDVDNATIRLMPPNVQMTAGYFTLKNNFNDEQILVGAKSDFFGKIEIHLSKKDGDTMKMLKQDSVSISANTILEFKPMGYHLMLMKPKENISLNQSIDINLFFASGKKLKVRFLVKKMDHSEMNHSEMDHSEMGHSEMNHMKMGNMMKNMSRPDFVYPAGVKGGKNMMPKKLMFGYKFGTMEMKCCRDGTSSVDENFIKGLSYSMTPISMTMRMHMMSAMYALDNKFSLMAMLPYVEKEMEMKMLSGMMMGKLHKTSSRGFGDLNLAALYRYSKKSNIKVAISIPSGEFNEKDHNMSGVLKMMPYPMQIGSGTYDLILGYSFQEILNNWSYGIQLNAVTRFDYNSEGWKYGDLREINLWASRPISKNFSISLGFDLEHQENIQGRSSFRMGTTPTWNEYFHSHLRASTNFGVNYKIPNSMTRIGFQCGTPIYRDVNGPQMDPDLKCNIGFSKMM